MFGRPVIAYIEVKRVKQGWKVVGGEGSDGRSGLAFGCRSVFKDADTLTGATSWYCMTPEQAIRAHVASAEENLEKAKTDLLKAQILAVKLKDGTLEIVESR